MIGQSTDQDVSRIGQRIRFDSGDEVCVFDEKGDAFILARRIPAPEFEKLFAKIVGRVCAELEMRPPRLDRDVTRKILSAANWLCGYGGRLCPDCLERQALKSLLGGQTVAEALAAK